MRPEIADKIASLPTSPGVYLMLGAKGEVFYVGKAKSLRDRVRSYFSGSDSRAFVARLDDLLADLEVVLTRSEKEALLLESELIKQHQPRFNVMLRDDKRYLCLRLDVRQPYPRLEVVRRFAKDGARYFGPYHSASALREALRIVNRFFQLRTCSDQVLANRTRPCLQYQIKRCPAPCVFDLSRGEYQQNVESVIAFLSGRQTELVESLRRRMEEHAEAERFESAAILRDQIDAIEASLERQRMVSRELVDRDIVGLYREGPHVEVHLMQAREGRLVDARRFSFGDLEQPTSEVLAEFATRYYVSDRELPDEILFPREMEWHESLGQLLTERRGKRVQALVPQRGDKLRLVEMAAANARQAFVDKQREAGAAKTAVERLQRALHLRRPPERIECYDISHLQGGQIVASAVRFEQGLPRKDLYRHYRIRSTQGQDDFQSMYEVIGRRARRGIEEGELPDLMVIDGGKGQLAAARAALDDHGVDEVDVIGLAKSRLRDDDGAAPTAASDLPTELTRSPERVFLAGQKNPIVLRQNSAELFLLTRARDEAHRFAITFHRRLRGKASTRSALDSIAGVGPKRRKVLLRHFGSIARLRAASLEEVAKVVGEVTARRVLAALAATGEPQAPATPPDGERDRP